MIMDRLRHRHPTTGGGSGTALRGPARLLRQLPARALAISTRGHEPADPGVRENRRLTALTGLVLLKLASTGYRTVRYYRGSPRYRQAGAPAPALRLWRPFSSPPPRCSS
jgi:hypothetical protein